jgi:hypothetical protein
MTDVALFTGIARMIQLKLQTFIVFLSAVLISFFMCANLAIAGNDGPALQRAKGAARRIM